MVEGEQGIFVKREGWCSSFSCIMVSFMLHFELIFHMLGHCGCGVEVWFGFFWRKWLTISILSHMRVPANATSRAFALPFFASVANLSRRVAWDSVGTATDTQIRIVACFAICAKLCAFLLELSTRRHVCLAPLTLPARATRASANGRHEVCANWRKNVDTTNNL